MKSSELEIAKIRDGGDRFRQKVDLAKYVIACATGLGALWLIFEGLAKIVARQDADGISALAKVIEAVHIGSILGYIFGAGAAIAWRKERLSKKRAIREKSRYQKMVEGGDKNRSSSGLNESGDDPEEE
ncbi:hypothetical protein GJ697_12245 [Pseudoduganella sp. FT25W]|uniref:Uncharacterized protein n=1 Tax=Duganella alba TaxID=2666081 RepID=A0A6L5QI25_9BURK|nr:hypothetical protein [Duganella alba]MRX08611.1 hypothetical protein [Duganella alba]MRX19817.1 hypothetical protein [Duganella alba]